jgi:hypothetical protein
VSCLDEASETVIAAPAATADEDRNLKGVGVSRERCAHRAVL